jgi:hypothetical protein
MCIVSVTVITIFKVTDMAESVIAFFWTLSIVCILIKLLRFGSLSSSVFRPRPGLRLADPGGPTARVSVIPPLSTLRRKKIQLPKSSNFIKI